MTFARAADFHEATFRGTPVFRQATFSGDADFSEATFSPAVNFWGATFGSRCELGPLRAGVLRLDGARFDGPVTIQARCRALHAQGIRFRCVCRMLDADRPRASRAATPNRAPRGYGRTNRLAGLTMARS